ncbi:histidine triad nucleotide-binding protein [Desulfuromonas thiophila]|uniref:Histidine triad (HIT) family protein n=1 Tax=Desulfuromonas thiophila TaxID=57664 RepID=A0A1G7CYC7_9BACT|nr:histidine triad nucleotide-binding protein [Desulfuromonas thiophila]MCK9171894.1 histidine triad nucleotide-binding protein [Desulfuromonas thiophila]MDD3800721.1 histidine triad nucleotide-binding protein [Desulfuromonas thiophila]MDY0398457.1 histidine triad nucleotide-binding protein [Desulfuromonas thiophila]SDE44454.1 histidine triad (HIT) family protein [Desulfuromonas thiophila]
MNSCLFCEIAAGRIAARRLYEDEQVVAFADIDPKAPVHFLVIPRRHIASLADVQTEDGALLGHLLRVVAQLAHEQDFSDSGYRVVTNCHADGGQSVDHLHFHVLAGRALQWPPG